MYRILIASKNDCNLFSVRDALSHEFELHELTGETISPEDIVRTISEYHFDLIVLDSDMGNVDGLSVMRTLGQTQDTPVVMLTSADVDSQTVMALGAGATDCLALPCSKLVIEARIRAACRRDSRAVGAQDDEQNGRMIAFIGAKGGVGTTTVAVNTGLALSERTLPVTLVDLRGYFGTMASHFGVYPDEHPHNLAEILDEPADDITADRIGRLLVHHTSGMKALLGAQNGDGYHRITADQADRLVDGLRGHSRYTIFDLPPWPTEAVETVLRRCEQVILVLEREAASVQAARVMLSTLVCDGVVHGDIGAVVVNRSALACPLSVDHLRKQISCPIIAMIPPASEACAAAARSREPLIQFCHDSDCVAALDGLADKLTQDHLCELAF